MGIYLYSIHRYRQIALEMYRNSRGFRPQLYNNADQIVHEEETKNSSHTAHKNGWNKRIWKKRELTINFQYLIEQRPAPLAAQWHNIVSIDEELVTLKTPFVAPLFTVFPAPSERQIVLQAFFSFPIPRPKYRLLCDMYLHCKLKNARNTRETFYWLILFFLFHWQDFSLIVFFLARI